MDELEASFHASDDITSLSNSEIIDNLKSDSAVPEGYLFNAIDERLLLYLLQMTNDRSYEGQNATAAKKHL